MINQNLIFQILIVYCLLAIVVYFASDFMLFPSPKSSYQDTSDIIKLITPDGKRISAIYLKNPKAEYTILFSHGNFEDIGTIMPLLEEYVKHGYSVFAYDYHGYGTSEGSSNEAKSYLDINAAYQYLTQSLHISPTHIILHGRSLGSGPSLDLAIREPIGGLILESPIYTAFRVMTKIPLFPIDKFRNDQKITQLKVPVLIIHGTQDEVVAFWHGEKLYERATSPKTLLRVERAGHNNVVAIAKDRYWQAINKFVDSLAR
jgi:hypothetical protein